MKSKLGREECKKYEVHVYVCERERVRRRGVGEREMWQRFQCDNRYLWISDPSKSGILSTRRSKLET